MSNPGSDSVEKLFTQALAHHQAGRLGEAEALYRRILSQWPGHAGAWHAMGVLAGQVGQPEVALGFFRNALTLLPDQPVFLSNLGENRRWPRHRRRCLMWRWRGNSVGFFGGAGILNNTALTPSAIASFIGSGAFGVCVLSCGA